MERWVQKLCFLKALEKLLFHIRFKDLSSIFGTPDYMIFNLINAVIQTQDSHGYQYTTFIPALRRLYKCRDAACMRGFLLKEKRPLAWKSGGLGSAENHHRSLPSDQPPRRRRGTTPWPDHYTAPERPVRIRSSDRTPHQHHYNILKLKSYFLSTLRINSKRSSF